MRYGDAVLATYDVVHGDDDIGACIGPAVTLTGWTDSLSTYDNGEIRFGGYEGETRGGGCVGDAGHGGCFDTSCGSGAECSVRATHVAPVFSRYACAPIGAKQAGEACTFTADAAGAYADCATGLACVDGTCHVRCTQLTGSNACSTCAFVPGYPDEVSVCP